MKKVVFILLIALFVVNNLQAQSSETLTNTTIIKMVKGKLSDDLIIDEINSSKVNFDLSDESVKSLKAANVSDPVMQAMKAVNETQNPAASAEIILPAAVATAAVIPLSQAEAPAQSEIATAAAVPSTQAEGSAQSEIIQTIDSTELAASEESEISDEKITAAVVAAPAEEALIKQETAQPTTETIQTNTFSIETSVTESGTLITIEKPALTLDALSYVIPVTELIPFYNKEFSSLADVIQEWDKKIRASLEKEKQSTEAISKLEIELTDLKNTNAKPFSNQIIEQKKNLVSLWEKHKAIKVEMVNEGKNLVEELTKVSKETQSAIDTKFKEVSKNVKNTDPDPSAGETLKAVDIPIQKFNSTVTGYFAPVTMMLVCYQNEIITVQNTIGSWNNRAMIRIQKDSELKKRLNPLQEELTQYLATSKQEQKLKKKEISALKKQCDAIEKERKQLAKLMADESVKLSEELNKMKTEVQSVVQERFTDIIENIDHSYKDKFNL